jgi:hypothetical protein
MTNEEVIQALQHLNGTRYVPSVKPYIAEMSGRIRVVGPGEKSTHEYDPERIHIIVDEQQILGLHFS